MFLSIALFGAAALGAFANAKKTAVVTSVPGYIKQSGVCVFKNNCSVEQTDVLCTATQTGGAQIYGMDPSDCTVELWRLH